MRTLIAALALAASLAAQPNPTRCGDFWCWGNVAIHVSAIPVIWNGEPAFITTQFKTNGWATANGGPVCEWNIHAVIANDVPVCAIGHHLELWSNDWSSARSDKPVSVAGGPQVLLTTGRTDASWYDLQSTSEMQAYVGVQDEGRLVGCDPQWNPCRGAPGQNYHCGYFPRMVSAWLISLVKVR